MASTPVSKEGIEKAMQATVDVGEKERVHAQRMLSEWGVNKDDHSVQLFLALKCLTPGRVSKRAFSEWKDVVRQKREVSRDFWVVPDADATQLLQANRDFHKYVVTPQDMNRLQQSLAGPDNVVFPGHTLFAATTPFWQLPNSAFKFSAGIASESVSSPCASSRFGPAQEGQHQPPTLGEGHAQTPLSAGGHAEGSDSSQGHAQGLGSAQGHAQGSDSPQCHAQRSDSPQTSGKRVGARLLSRTNSECPSTEDAMEVIALQTKEVPYTKIGGERERGGKGDCCS